MVLVDHAAEDASSPYQSIDRDCRAGVVVGWVLIQAPMWTVPVEMALVVEQHPAGVLLVVDQHPVGALGCDATHESFGERVGPRSQLHPIRTIGTDVSG